MTKLDNIRNMTDKELYSFINLVSNKNDSFVCYVMDKEVLDKVKQNLGIKEYLKLINEDKNLNMAYTSLSQYIYLLEDILEKRRNIIDEQNELLLEIAKNELEMINWLKSKSVDIDNENWRNELEEILERGKNE